MTIGDIILRVDAGTATRKDIKRMRQWKKIMRFGYKNRKQRKLAEIRERNQKRDLLALIRKLNIP